MELPTKILPRISRFFSAKKVQQQLSTATSIIVSLSCLGLIALNATQANAQNSSGDYLEIARSPFSPSAHFALATKFRSINDDKSQLNEMNIVQDLIHQNSNILGDSTEISDTIHDWNDEPKQLEEKLAFWNTVISNHPDYRDAYLQAAYLAKQLHKDALASELMERAKKSDPSLE